MNDDNNTCKTCLPLSVLLTLNFTIPITQKYQTDLIQLYKSVDPCLRTCPQGLQLPG